jgi:pantoate--beta-alanine ligase
MKILKIIDEVREITDKWKKEGNTIGLVPTMGFLHEGHESLIKKAVSGNDKVVVSIFVNPLQFGPNEDLATYPKNIERDSFLCDKNSVDLIFAPEASEMYYEDASTYVNVTKITEGLCGRKRPGHFQGVCTVVTKLFNIVKPDRAYFGEKDAQQLAVVKRIVRDLSFDIEVVGCPIIREAYGLAKSSRNSYLSKEERESALVLSRSLSNAEGQIKKGLKDVDKIRDIIVTEIGNEPLASLDYVEIVDAENLEAAENLNRKILIAIAVYIGKTRLIDNITV